MKDGYPYMGAWRSDCKNLDEMVKVIGLDDEAEGYAANVGFYHDLACQYSIVRSSDFITQETFFGASNYYAWRRDHASRALRRKIRGEKVSAKKYKKSIAEKDYLEPKNLGFAGQIRLVDGFIICFVAPLSEDQLKANDIRLQ